MIAELSANHNGDIERAFALIDAAAKAGAHAIKLQTYTADTITIDHDGPEFLIHGGLWDGRRLYDLYQEAHMPWDWQPRLFAHARASGLTCFSSPFDETAIDFLETLDAPAYKIASFELIDHALIARAAKTGKPLIMSRGMATHEEITDALAVAKEAGCQDVILLHCVSGYPSAPEDMNLRSIPDLAERVGVAVGLSDHTLGVTVATASVALGAVAIEKHFTLRRADGGPDAAFSLEPDELKTLVEQSRVAWSALGKPFYPHSSAEASQMQFRRSLYVVTDIAKGELFTLQNLRSIRPGLGLAPRHLGSFMGRKAARDIARGTPVSWDMLG